MLNLFKAKTSLAVNVFILYQLENVLFLFFESDIVPPCHYCFSCGVDFAILLNLEQFEEKYIFFFYISC